MLVSGNALNRFRRLAPFGSDGRNGIVILPPWSCVDVTSQPRRHGNQPVRHGTRQRGFDDLVEAGEDKGADAGERGAHERLPSNRNRAKMARTLPNSPRGRKRLRPAQTIPTATCRPEGGRPG